MIRIRQRKKSSSSVNTDNTKVNKRFIQIFEQTSKNVRPFLFEKETVHILSMDYGVDFEGVYVNGSVVWFHTNKYYGRISFYPKSNKIHIHKYNKWVDNGLRWIVSRRI